MKKNFVFALSALLVLAAMVGCEKRPEGLPELYPTKITIKTPDGKPITDAFVSVANLENPIRFNIGGKTNKDGVAEMMVQLPTGKFMGAPEGKLAVAVTKSIRVVPDGDENNSFGAQVIDAAYNDANNSPLSIEVKKGNNEASFECEVNPDYADKI